MPLSADNVIQEATGTTAAGTSHAVTLPSGTTDGNTLVVAIGLSSGVTPTFTGFAAAKSQGVATWVYYKPAAAGETTWTFTTGASTPSSAWYVAELSGVELVLPVDATVGVTSTPASGGTASTGTTPLNAGLYSMALAVFGTATIAGTNTVSWSGYTNGFTEVVDVDAGTLPKLAVARLFESSTTRTFETTATLTTDDTARTVNAVMVVFRAADSPVVAPLAWLFGYEWGTHGGINSHSGSTNMMGTSLTGAPSGTFGTNYLIQAASARNSGYGLRVVQSGAAAYVRHGALSGTAGTWGLNVRVISATGTVVAAEVVNNSLAASAQIVYDPTATKFGVRCGSTGTVSWESGTTALSTWRWIDLRVRTDTTTWHAEWRIETGTNTYTDQAAADLTGQSAGTAMATFTACANTAQTVTAEFDDVVMSAYYTAFPLGPHQVRGLTVDPAGTPTVSGTTTNFSVFTANGTLAAWNATTARNALDEVPPTVSAAADGVVQTATAATDYMQFPMADYTLGPTEFVNGVRMLAPIWSGTGAGAGDIAIRGYDGTTETALATVSQLTPGSPTAISTTAPLWRTAMWQSTNGWTQAELNACALRVGFSGDATPDMGVSALYLEVAIGRTKTQPLFGDMATAEIDPTRLGVVSVTATAPTTGTGDTSLVYEESGTPTTVPVAEGTTVTEQINAPDKPTVNRITLFWPPEPDPVA